MTLTDEQVLRAVRVAIDKHQRAGGGAGDPWDMAIYRAGYAAALAAVYE